MSGGALSAVPSDVFRRLMSRWPTGVSVVTGRAKERDSGLTVNSLVSVSLEPPTLLVSLTEEAETSPVIRSSRWFGVTLLAHDQRAISERFALQTTPEAKFAGLPLRRGPHGVALLEGGVAWYECRLKREVAVADHRLFIGEVQFAQAGSDVPPLVFYHSGYAERSEERSLLLPAPRADRA